MKKPIVYNASLAAASILLAASTLARAANGVWAGGGADGGWATSGNWAGNIAPGVTDGTTVNTDTALFTNNPTQKSIIADLNRNLQNFTYDAGAGVIIVTTNSSTVNPLLLTSGGKALITAALTSTSGGFGQRLFNTPLIIEGNNGTYTFQNDAPSAINGSAIGICFGLNGAINGVSTAGNTTTLNLAGSQAGWDGVHPASGNLIIAAISDGAGGGKLSLVKSGTGIWDLSGTNTYTGATVINGGLLDLNYQISASLKAYAGPLIGSGSALVFGGSGGTIREKTANNLIDTNIFASTTVNAGQNVMTILRTTGGSGFWNLGSSLTRSVGANLDIQKGGSGTYQVPAGTVNTLPLDSRGVAYLTAETFTDWAGYNNATNLNSGSYTKTASTATTLVGNAVVGPVTNIALAANTKITCLLNTTNLATINLGGFTLTNGGTLFSSTVVIAGSSITNGTLVGPTSGADVVVLQNSPQPLTVAAVIADNGSASALTKGAAGVLTLTAANTYSGVTYINAGSLQLGNGGTSGSINSSSVVTNHGTLVFNRSDATTFGLVINGIGGVTNAGSGAVTITANNSYTGNTVVNAGTTLNLGNSGTSGTVSNSVGIINNGTLNVNLSGSFNYPGVISGSGTLVNLGSGNTILSGNNVYSGNTLIQAGTVSIGASAFITNSTAIVLSSGATLDVSARTNFALNGALLPNGQILAGAGTVLGSVSATGSSVITPATNGVYGTLSISSNLTVNGVGLKFDVSTGSKDRLNVGGTLNLQSGSLTVNLPSGSIPNGSYQLINYTNNLLGDVANITVVFPGGSQVASLSSATTNWITLIVASANPNNLAWQGTDGTNPSWWDVSTTLNWTNGSTPSVFSQNDNVQLDDTASTYTVDIRQGVSPGQVVVNSTTDYTLQTSVAGKISGGASLLKTNSSTLTILTTNDYSGSTTIAAGTLKIGNGSVGGRLGSGNITNNADLIYNSPGSQIVGNTVSGSGNLTVQAGAVILTANNSFSGNTTNASGTLLQLGLSGASGSFGSGNLDDEGGLIFNRSDTPTFNNVISGVGNVTNIGSGTLLLGGANSYSGATAINSGTVKLGSSTALGAGLLTMNGGTAAAGTLDLNGFDVTLGRLVGATGTVLSQIRNNVGSGVNTLTINSPVTATFAGLIADNTSGSGKVSLVHLGPSALTLNAANTYSGGTLIAGGNLTLGNNTALGTGLVTMSNGVVTLGTINFVNPMNVLSGTTNTLNGGNNANWIAVITNNGTLNITTPGAGTFSVTAAWPNFGGTIVLGSSANGIRLFLGSTGAANAAWDMGTGFGNIYMRDGGTMDMGSLAGVSTTAIAGSSVSGNTVYRIGALNQNTVFSGTINNYPSIALNTTVTCAITKVGTGTLTLDGILNYSGATTVNGGVLVIGGANSSSTSLDTSLSLTVNSNAVLDVSGRSDGTLYLGNSFAQSLVGSGTVNGNITASGSHLATINFSGTNNGILNVTSATLAPAGSVAATLVITNDALLNNGTVLNFDFANAPTPGGGTNDLIRVGGNLTLTGTVSLRPNFLSGTPVIGQPYTLITYAGTLTGDTNNLALDESALNFSHLTAEFSTSTSGAITVVFNTNPSDLIWQGYGTNSWQPGVVTNWLNAGINTNFYQFDSVTFDDTASNSTVALVSTLQPSRIAVSNSVNNYIFTNGGSGLIAGGTTLDKRGSGILSITTANTYSGGTTNSGGGTIDIGGVATALGTGPLVLNKGTFLSTNVGSLVIANAIISAAGSTNVIQADGVGNTRLSGNISGSSSQLEFASVTNKGLDFSGDNSGYSGVMKFDGAIVMRFMSAASGNLPSVNWDLGNAGAILGSKVVDGTPTQYRLGALSGGGSVTLSGHLSSAGGAGANVTWEIGALGLSTTFGGTITNGNQSSGANNTSLVKVGAGTLTLTGTNAYTGNTTVSNGILELAQSIATLATNSTVAIASGAQLKLTAVVTNQVASLITNGVVASNGLYTSANSSGYIIGSGYLRVGSAPLQPSVEPILTSYNGSQLTLTWTQSNWTLEVQTNNLSTGLSSTGWVPVAGATSPYVITVNPSQPSVFYRLVYP